MKKYIIAFSTMIVLGPACMVKTVFYDVNPIYESHCFSKETIAVCPFNGRWKIEGNDTAFERVPDFYPYAEAVALQIGTKRKCLSVIGPRMVEQKVPEIESLVYKHRHLFQKVDPGDSSVFGYLHGALNADYLLFFESILFNNEEPVKSDSVAVINSTILVFQVWDLKNRQFMYRGESKGAGEESRGGRAGKDVRSSKWCIQNAASELVKSLPTCK
jgi:hypothetical protein